MDEGANGPEFDVAEELGLGADVPLAQANSHVVCAQVTNAVSGGKHVASADERRAAHVHTMAVLVLQDGRLPRVFTELRVAVLQDRGLDASEEPGGVTPTALNGRVEHGVAATHEAEAAAAQARQVTSALLWENKRAS